VFVDRTSEPKLPGPMCRAGHLHAALREADRMAAWVMHRLPVRFGSARRRPAPVVTPLRSAVG